jgi:hypothetical protein
MDGDLFDGSAQRPCLELGEGGHFAAWEQPHLLAAEVRAGFRPLRK